MAARFFAPAAPAALDVRPILFVNGFLLITLAVSMGLPALVDFVYDDLDWQVFAVAGVVTFFFGAALALANRPADRLSLDTRQAFVLTASAWVLASLFAALPFYFSILDMSLADSFFEAMSGLTTTGSTVIVGLDDLPSGILLWRATLQWLGGIGIIVMAVALLPMLRIGGMQLFRMESSEKSEKALPRVSQVAGALVVIYLALSGLCAAALWAAGMSPFEAVCHAMTTVSTGGYSTSDGSIGHFASPLIEWTVILFMVAGGVTFVLFITPWRRRRWAILHDSQLRWFLAFLGFFTALVAMWLWVARDVAPGDALRLAAFNVVSVVTTTGFATADYSAWGGFAQVTFFVLTFIGGCTGSTSGGIKIFRWQVLFAMAGVHLRRLLHPHGTFVIDFNRQNISDAVVRSVVGFMAIYLLSFVLLSVSLALAGLDVAAALSAAATAIGNVGPGIGPDIGPAGNFAGLTDTAKWLLSLGMLLGRLELFTVIVLFSPLFWRG